MVTLSNIAEIIFCEAKHDQAKYGDININVGYNHVRTKQTIEEVKLLADGEIRQQKRYIKYLDLNQDQIKYHNEQIAIMERLKKSCDWVLSFIDKIDR